MVQFERMPIRCAVRCTSSHSSAVHLSSQIFGARVARRSRRRRPAASRDRPRAAGQDLGHRQAVVLVEEEELHRGEGLEVDRRA